MEQYLPYIFMLLAANSENGGTNEVAQAATQAASAPPNAWLFWVIAVPLAALLVSIPDIIGWLCNRH